MALKWLSNHPGVAAPIFGARTLERQKENLGATEVVLIDEAIQALDRVSAPTPGGYPYGAFGAGQRQRWLQDGTPAPVPTVAGGSDHPTGRV